MKIWYEVEKDAFSYFEWFDKKKISERIDKIPSLSVFSVNGSMLFESGGKSDFIDLCSSEIIDIFQKKDLVSNYKLYLFANIEIKDKNSRVESYKKVWKLLQSKWHLETFIKGPEVETEVEGRSFYSSIAEFGLENLSVALEIISCNPKRYTIIVSKKDDVLTERSIRTIFGIALNKYSNYKDEIDYFSLSLHLCQEGDIVFRWGDSSDEAEIAMVYNRDMFTVFTS